MELHVFAQAGGGDDVAGLLVGAAPRAPAAGGHESSVGWPLESGQEVFPGVIGDFVARFVEVANDLAQQVAGAGADGHGRARGRLGLPSDGPEVAHPRQCNQVGGQHYLCRVAGGKKLVLGNGRSGVVPTSAARVRRDDTYFEEAELGAGGIGVDDVFKVVGAIVLAEAGAEARPLDFAARVARTVGATDQIAIDTGIGPSRGNAHGVEPKRRAHVNGEHAAVDGRRPNEVQEIGVEIRVKSRPRQETVTRQIEVAAAGHQAAADVVAKSVYLDSG